MCAVVTAQERIRRGVDEGLVRLMATRVVGRKGKEGDREVCKERNSMPRRWAPKRCACVLLLLFSGMLMRGGVISLSSLFSPFLQSLVPLCFFLRSLPSLARRSFPFARVSEVEEAERWADRLDTQPARKWRRMQIEKGRRSARHAVRSSPGLDGRRDQNTPDQTGR